MIASPVMAIVNLRGVGLLRLPFGFGSTCALVACVGGAQMMLKGPVTDQCTSVGLNGCDEITEGALLYADGKQIEGEKKLERGLHANAGKATELKKFADAIALVGRIPGASQYVAPLQPAVRLIQRVAAEDAQRVAETMESESQPQQVARKNVTLSKWVPPSIDETNANTRTQMVSNDSPRIPVTPPVSSYYMVAGNGLAEQCRFVGTPKMLCLNELIEGTRTVSDVIVPSGCSSDVVVIGRIAIEPDWVVYASAGRGADVHGAALPLRPMHTLTVGVAYKSEDPPPDLRCGITVVWRPWIDDSSPDKPRVAIDPRTKALLQTLREKAASRKASDSELRLLHTMCQQFGDDSCSK